MKLFTALQIHLTKFNVSGYVQRRLKGVVGIVHCFLIFQSVAFGQIQISANINPPSCYNGNDASLMLSATGGNSGNSTSKFYLFSINGGSFSAQRLISNLSSGTYQVAARDSLGVTSANFTFVVPNQNQHSISLPTQINIIGNQGQSPNAAVTAPAHLINNNQYQQQVPIWSASGNYSTSNNICVDQYLCSNFGTKNSNPLAIADLDSIQAIEFTVYWNCGQANWSFYLNGTYIGKSGLYTSNNCGCAPELGTNGTYPSIYTFNNSLVRSAWNKNGNNVLSIKDSSASTCKVAVLASVKYAKKASYLWSPSTGVSNPQLLNPVLNPNTNTTYTLQYKDVNGCTESKSVLVKVYPKPEIMVSVSKESANRANDGSITVKIKKGQGPFTYKLNNLVSSDSVFANLKPGKYKVWVTDPMGSNCDTMHVVVQPKNPFTVSKVKGNVTCVDGDNGWARVIPNGGYPPYKFKWANGRTKSQLDTIPLGVYPVEITDSLGFVIRDTIEIVNLDTIPPVITSQVFSVRISNRGNTCDTYVQVSPPSVYDNCKLVFVRNDYTGTDNASARYPSGKTWVNWVFRDNSGNENRFTQIVEVVDETAPVALPKLVSYISLSSAQGVLTPAMVDSASYDNCGIVYRDVFPNTFNCFGDAEQLVTLTVRDAMGNEHTAQSLVRIIGATNTLTAKAISNVSGMPNGYFYTGYGAGFVQLEANTTDNGQYTYLWSPNIGLDDPTIKNPKASPNASLTYSVVVTNASGCPAVKYTPVCVIDVATRGCGGEPTGKVNICHNGRVISVAAAAIPAHLAHGDQLGTCGPVVCIPSGGGSGGGGGERAMIYPDDLEVFCYPNPFESSTSLVFHSSNPENLQISIHDMAGRLVQENKDVSPFDRLEIESEFASGIYYVTVKQSSSTRTVKLIKAD